MESVIFSTKNNNKYLYSKNGILFLPPELEKAFYNNENSNCYYSKKSEFLKKSGYGLITKPSFVREMSSDIVFQQLANIRQIVIEVTESCNLQCKYCGYGELYDNNEYRRGKNQLFSSVKVLIDYFAKIWKSQENRSFNNIVFISFYGGEPLLNMKLIKQTINYLESLDLPSIIFRYNMTTNAVLLNKFADFLEEKKVHLLISLDGNRENNSYRLTKNKNNSFDCIFNNLKNVKNKHSEYFNEYVNFNSVLHDRNSVNEIIEFINTEFGKTPKISELTTASLSENKQAEFNNLFNSKCDNSNTLIAVADDQDVENLLGNVDVSIFNFFIDSFVDNTYNNVYDLFFSSESDLSYFPTGTCLPFQKKLFLTVSNKIYPCEKIGLNKPLGCIINNKVEIDFNYITSLYSAYYSKIADKCERCLTWNNCGQCVFLLNESDKDLFCNNFCNKTNVSKYLSRNLTTAEVHPFLYKKLFKELIND